jgi:dTDP-4-dehydrorhamnose 3,5-epimerase-like enzyme
MGAIAGLHWQASFRCANGGDAFAVRLPSMHAVTVEFHGRERRGDDRLRLHVGTAHRLIFVGDPQRVIHGQFIDCRRDSATRHHRVALAFHPDSARVLCIPAGVAHAFRDLEGLFVVDEPALFLPDVSTLVRDGLERGASDDGGMVAAACPDDQLPVVDAHGHAASDRLYEYLGHELRGGCAVTPGFPLGELIGRDDVVDTHRSGADRTPEWEPIAAIHGAGWQRNLVLTSRASAESGVIVMEEPGVRQVVDHGVHPYEHGAYGIHVSLEDRLTFLGDPDRVARALLVDCRAGSPTLHARVEVEFRPSPFRQLIIPPGVAHALQGLSGVFTLNRAKPYLDRDGRYPADQRTVEWPLGRDDYPVVPPHDGEPPPALIEHLVHGEQALLHREPPSGLAAASDAHG